MTLFKKHNANPSAVKNTNAAQNSNAGLDNLKAKARQRKNSNAMFNKEIRRSIRSTLGRFVAIAAITALGTGFYAGLRMTAPDMNLAADTYYDQTNLMDIRVICSLGLSEEDIAALREVSRVESVMPAYETDALGTLNGEQYAIRIHSLNASALASVQTYDGIESSDDNYLNRLTLTEGVWPQNSGECVISADKVMNNPVEIGDTIVFTQGTQDLEETLLTTTYTVVGKVTSPYYVCSSSLGTTSLGSGSIQQYIYIPETDFAEDFPITEAFVTVEGARELSANSQEYKDLVNKCVSRIKNIGSVQAALRESEVKKTYQEELDAQWDAYYAARDSATEQFAEASAELADAAAQITATESAIAIAEVAIDAGILDSSLSGDVSSQVPSSGITIGNQTYSQQDVADAIEQTQADNQDAPERIEEAKSQLSDAKEEYRAGLSEYESSYSSAMSQLSDAEAQLTAAQAELDATIVGEWYILDRTKNYGTESFASDATRVDNIAQVFPFIFFLVAALVCLTTMTRMIDEERILIGTFKALGYSKVTIATKYLIYAALAGLVGSVVGIVILSCILPMVIMSAYGIIYSVPAAGYPINMGLALLSGGLGVGITLIATLGAVLTTLRERPAALMLPRAPKVGKRILLERIKPLWSRVSFSGKVTFRNLFRYKKRFIMTVIGIAGCTALLLTGWGLRNSINDIIDKHYGIIISYAATINVESDISEESTAQLKELLNDDLYVDDYMWCYNTTMLAVPEGTKNVTVSFTVPQDSVIFEDFHVLQNRVTGEKYDLDAGGIVITEKLGNTLGLGVGDTLVLYTQDEIGNPTDTGYEFEIVGLCEGYLGNAAFVSPQTYEETWHENPVYNEIIADTTSDTTLRSEFSVTARAIDGVKTVSYNDELINAYRTMLKSVDLIVWVLVIAAGALAFIVLYNLTNININERIREIATLKVLGFTPREVSAYIYRETALLTGIGALLGLVLGVFMEAFVVTTAEVDMVMFGRDIHPDSFIISLVLTLVFSVIVMLAMRRKLRAVNMVESLKSID